MQQWYEGSFWCVELNAREMVRLRKCVERVTALGAEPDPDGGYGAIVNDALELFTPDGNKPTPDLLAIQAEQYEEIGTWI